MRLIEAGIGGTKENFLYNFTRNSCQKEYFMPIPGITSVMQFYASLPGAMDSYSIEIMDSDDNATGAVAGSSITGEKPDGTFYAVFGDITPAGPVPSSFYMKFTITVGGSDYIYFTNHFKINCNGTLNLLQGCYPNELWPADATDCNGIYYGFPVGDISYRYFHWAYVRNAVITEQKNTFKFTYFNSKKAYKNTFGRSYILEIGELVPAYFKDILIGIYNRGNIFVDGVEWRLAEETEISVVDLDSKLWRVDVELAEECKQTFGCGPSDCTLPVPVPPDDECCTPSVGTVSIESGDGG